MTYSNKIKAFERPDGSVSIHYFVLSGINNGESEDEYVERITRKLKRDMPELSTFVEHNLLISDIPNSRENRGEWNFKDGKIKVNQIKVQEKLNKIEENKLKKQLVLSKLKITESELSDILKK